MTRLSICLRLNGQKSQEFHERAEWSRREVVSDNFQAQPFQQQYAPPQTADQPTVGPVASPGTGAQTVAGGRRIQVRPRGRTPLSFRSLRRGDEQAWVINVPTRITTYDDASIIEVAADRIVVWTDVNTVGLDSLGSGDGRVEFYMEGNIVFMQGQRIIRAERMYYNWRDQTGVILEAELLSDVPGYDGKVRIRSNVLRQLSPSLFQANDAAFTTSRLGVPQYWVQSDVLELDSGPTSLFDQVAGQFDQPEEATGGFLDDFQQLRVSSQDSALYVGGWPIFYWPRFSTDLTRRSSLYLDGLRFGNDNVFGTQVLTRWNLFQVLGIDAPANADWTASADYLSERGFGFGTDLDYAIDRFLGNAVRGEGYIHSWFINDSGLDNLGQESQSCYRLRRTFAAESWGVIGIGIQEAINCWRR